MVYRDYHLGRAWIEEAAGKHQEADHQRCMAAQMERVIALLAEEEAKTIRGRPQPVRWEVSVSPARGRVTNPFDEWQRNETW